MDRSQTISRIMEDQLEKESRTCRGNWDYNRGLREIFANILYLEVQGDLVSR